MEDEFGNFPLSRKSREMLGYRADMQDIVKTEVFGDRSCLTSMFYSGPGYVGAQLIAPRTARIAGTEVATSKEAGTPALIVAMALQP